MIRNPNPREKPPTCARAPSALTVAAAADQRPRAWTAEGLLRRDVRRACAGSLTGEQTVRPSVRWEYFGVSSSGPRGTTPLQAMRGEASAVNRAVDETSRGPDATGKDNCSRETEESTD